MRSKQQQEQELDRLIDSILGFDSAALQRDMADGFDRYRRPENHLVAFYARVACLAVGLAVAVRLLFSPLQAQDTVRTSPDYPHAAAVADTVQILQSL